MWQPDPDIAQLVTRIIARAKSDAIITQREDNRRRQSVPIAGADERIQRAAHSLKLDLDVELAIG